MYAINKDMQGRKYASIDTVECENNEYKFDLWHVGSVYIILYVDWFWHLRETYNTIGFPCIFWVHLQTKWTLMWKQKTLGHSNV